MFGFGQPSHLKSFRLLGARRSMHQHVPKLSSIEQSKLSKYQLTDYNSRQNVMGTKVVIRVFKSDDTETQFPRCVDRYSDSDFHAVGATIFFFK